ncbi:glycoside hydrolase family 1 protein [Lacticaseibacillus suihuaensis]
MTNYQFPSDFWWGGATSGPQSEGRFDKAHRNLFDYWYDHDPAAFYQQVGPNTASDFYHTYDADLALMKDIGLNSLRTSIQWSRLIKDFETGAVDPAGVVYYNRVIDACLAAGITPVLNLHHFDLPVALYQRYGGWTSRHVVDLYVKFAKACFAAFGDRVKNWFTFNEPQVILDGEYLYRFHYPLEVDGQKAVQAAYNISLASACAIAAYRAMPQSQGGRIGIILNLTPAYAASEDPADQEAAAKADLWTTRLFLDPAVLGHHPQAVSDWLAADGVLWSHTAADDAVIAANPIDMLGVNYYHPFRVQRPAISPTSLMPWMPNNYFAEYQKPGRVMNVDKGWEIYPDALRDIATRLKDDYGNLPWYVSENGMGVSGESRFADATGVIQDDYRINFMTAHLKVLHQAIAAGANCFGYHVWTPFDCWSWANAYRNRYGLIAVDIRTQKRTVKASGRWFAQLATNHGFEG